MCKIYTSSIMWSDLLSICKSLYNRDALACVARHTEDIGQFLLLSVLEMDLTIIYFRPLEVLINKKVKGGHFEIH